MTHLLCSAWLCAAGGPQSPLPRLPVASIRSIYPNRFTLTVRIASFMRLDGSLEAAASLRVKLLDRLRGRSLFWQKKKPPRRAAAFKWFSRDFGQLLTSSRIELCHLIGALGRDAAFEHHLDQQGDGDGNRALAAEPVADGAQAGTATRGVRMCAYPWEQNRRGLCRNGSKMRIWKSLPHTHSFR
jgi:hypothetical protein